MLCMEESTDASASDTTVGFIFLPCIYHTIFFVPPQAIPRAQRSASNV